MTGRKMLSEADVLEIRKRAKTESYRKLGSEFRVSHSYIALLVHGKRRRDVTDA